MGSRQPFWPEGKPGAVSLPQRGTGTLLCRLTKAPPIELHTESLAHISAALFSDPESTASDLDQEDSGEKNERHQLCRLKRKTCRRISADY